MESEDAELIGDDQIKEKVFENDDLENFDIDRLKEMWSGDGIGLDNEKLMEEWNKVWEEDMGLFGH